MRKLVFSILFVMQVVFVFAQSGSGVTGKVVDSKTQKPLQNVVVTILNSPLTELTDASGKFTFKELSQGNQVLEIKTQGYTEQMIPVEIVSGKILDLGVVLFVEDQTQEQQLSLVTITENDLGDDNSGSESTSGLLQASRDVYQQAAAFNWGQARFRIRGLDNEYGTTMINGVSMNKIYDGRPQWSNWGGLNDATRNQEFTSGSAPSDYTFGGILGTQEINTRASIYRKGSRISFSGTNTNYSWRTMGTHASGMNAKGWAFVVSASRRWAEEGYFEGTDYSANSLFASVEKKFNDHHSLNFTSIYAQNYRGKNSPNTQEVTDIAGVKYNSYWGWQDGEKRNSRVKTVEEPILMLSHYWKFNSKTSLNTNLSYQIGKIGNSRLDFQGQDNPDPTYYRNLPSFYTTQFDDNGNYIGNSATNVLEASRAKFLTNRQINWNEIYDANRLSTDGNSYYVLYEDRTDDEQFNANTILTSQLSDNVMMNGAVNFRKLRSNNFQYLLDLLGGNYYKDFDNFGTGSQQEPDLNNPNRRVYEGDKFGYNYNLYATTIDAFTQFKFTYKKVDFYMAQSYSKAYYQREGLYRNGYYPTNSFGKSEKISFDNFGFKGGMTYKISGRHFIDLNGYYATKAPNLRNTFPNARANNNVYDNLESEVISSTDASYIIKTPKMKMRLTGFYSYIKGSTETSFFFADAIDDGSDDNGDSAFVAETINGLNKKNVGVEFGLEYQLSKTIKMTLAGTYGEFTYDSNPTVQLNIDDQATATNTFPIRDYGKANMKNYRQPGMPQTAASFGLEYRAPKFWWIGANANYLANNYIDVAPILRTDAFLQDPTFGNSGTPFYEATQERVDQLLEQEKFKDFTLVNLTGGKSWKVGNQTFGFFASINNVFDITYKTGGFEQARNSSFRQLNQDVSHLDTNGAYVAHTPSFGPKYFYGFGRTYFVNLYINF
ncbi:TonB-dependent receptor [Flavobacterium sp. CYK-4]|uniref:carboxypeptidase-like regulatory domain-containing protein n=1 Tax=Flavobacterium lotistagni TaxID=2709660 RepID=UPI00140AC355|nr:carboxypeptidase-like regulatory domain-containing protein [Flavobacterium lotistagni]NHM06080.1 TonB-dependent receptor [Flavobacterium lotistagni]